MDLRVEIRTGRMTGWGTRSGSDGTVKRWLSVASQSGGRILSDGYDIDYDTALTIYSANIDDDIQDTIYMTVVTDSTGEPQTLEFVLLRD